MRHWMDLISESPLHNLLRDNPHDPRLITRSADLLPEFKKWLRGGYDGAQAKDIYALGHAFDRELDFYHPDKGLNLFIDDLTAEMLKRVPQGVWTKFIISQKGADQGRLIHTLNNEPLPSETWLIHFTQDSPADIKRTGFRGTNSTDQRELWATLGAEKYANGYNFAFLAQSYEAINYSEDTFYGEGAILFQAAGVHTFHVADGDEEVIFWGPDVTRESMIIMYEMKPGTWSVHQKFDPIPTFRGSFKETIAYAIKEADALR